MKKLLLCILALLSAQAFGQAYPGTVLQNSSGNYSRAVPYPQVLVCVANDGNVPCVTRATTYSDSTLGTQCTQTGSSGLLIGNPTSGANCNNPGIGDTNGNFQLYLSNGQYTLCTFSGTWLCQQFTMGGSGSSGIACGSTHSVVYSAALNSFACDPFFTDDGAGHPTAKSLGLTDPTYSGFFYLTQGPAPPLGAANSIYFYAPVSVTSYAWVLPGAAGSGCMQASNAAGLVTISFTGSNCGSSTITLQTNGTNNSSQTLLNLVAGSNITITNTGGGNVQISGSASGFTALSNPTAPTVTPQGTTGSTTYSYEIVGCEDGSTCAYHSAATSAGTTTTGNAALVSTGCPASCSAANLLSAYADTLFGYRCLNVYRTAGGGSTGKIATCVDKTFIDTGLAGDSTSPPATNTTEAFVTMIPTSGGCNYPPGSPQGVDGFPCTPNALDDEFTSTNGIADANDPFWQWVHQSTATATMTNGMVSLQMANQSTNQLSCLIHPLPSAPYRISVLPYPSTLVTGSSSQPVELGLYESSSGKFITFDVLTSFGVTVSHWTNSTTFGANVASNGNAPWINGPTNYQFGRDGSNNLSFWHSQDGINYAKDYTETATNYFTSGPDNFAICINPHNGTAGTLIVDYDYVRVKNLAPGVNF